MNTLLVFALLSLSAADARTVLIAGQLGITAEPFEDGETTVGLNVVPLVMEWAAFERVGFRASSLLNWQFAGEQTGIGHRGGSLVAPFYFGSGPAPHLEGFYLGPLGTFAVNPLVDGSDLTMGVEGGWRLAIAEHWSFNVALQLGSSLLDRPEGSQWVPHTGLFPSFGYWAF